MRTQLYPPWTMRVQPDLADEAFHGDDDAGLRVGGGDVQRGEHAGAAGAEDEDVAGEFVDGEHQGGVRKGDGGVMRGVSRLTWVSGRAYCALATL